MNTTYGTPAGGYGSLPADPSSPARSRKKRWFRWGAGVALAGFLAGGGIALAAVSGGGTAAASSAVQFRQRFQRAGGRTEHRAQHRGQQLPPLPGPRPVGAGPAAPSRRRGREVTFHNKTGFHTLSFERGTIQSVSGSDVVIKAADGTTWTWQIVSDTVVRKNGAKTTTSALSAGETVFAGGPVVSGAKDARLIVIRAAVLDLLDLNRLRHR